MPSIESTVMSGCLSVTTRIACPTQSVPARVDRANRRNEVPVAMPRTPPPPFLQSCHRCKHESAENASRTSLLTKSSAATVRSKRPSWSSKRTRNISWEHPPGPTEDPDGAPLKLCAKQRTVQLQRCGWLKPEDVVWTPSTALGASCCSTFGTCEFLPGTRNLTALDTRLC